MNYTVNSSKRKGLYKRIYSLQFNGQTYVLVINYFNVSLGFVKNIDIFIYKLYNEYIGTVPMQCPSKMKEVSPVSDTTKQSPMIGLQKITDEDINQMTREQVIETLFDLKASCQHLYGLQQLSDPEIAELTQSEAVQRLMDIRQIALNTVV